MNSLAYVIGGLDTRLRRLEETIGDTTDTVLNFLSFREKLAAVETVTIWKRNINGSFMIGTSEVGDNLGDNRSAKVIVYEGDGS